MSGQKTCFYLLLAVLLSACSGNKFLSRKYLDGKYSEQGAHTNSVKAMLQEETVVFKPEVNVRGNRTKDQTSILLTAPQLQEGEFKLLKKKSSIRVDFSDASKPNSLNSKKAFANYTEYNLIPSPVAEVASGENRHVDAGIVFCALAAILFGLGLLTIYAAAPPLAPVGFLFTALAVVIALIAAIFVTWGLIQTKKDGGRVGHSTRIAFILSYLVLLGALLYEGSLFLKN
jgi:hypothetical protein